MENAAFYFSDGRDAFAFALSNSIPVLLII